MVPFGSLIVWLYRYVTVSSQSSTAAPCVSPTGLNLKQQPRCHVLPGRGPTLNGHSRLLAMSPMQGLTPFLALYLLILRAMSARSELPRRENSASAEHVPQAATVLSQVSTPPMSVGWKTSGLIPALAWLKWWQKRPHPSQHHQQQHHQRQHHQWRQQQHHHQL
jgi:hypothetical protein